VRLKFQFNTILFWGKLWKYINKYLFYKNYCSFTHTRSWLVRCEVVLLCWCSHGQMHTSSVYSIASSWEIQYWFIIWITKEPSPENLCTRFENIIKQIFIFNSKYLQHFKYNMHIMFTNSVTGDSPLSNHMQHP
jgi:hypothetical protein